VRVRLVKHPITDVVDVYLLCIIFVYYEMVFDVTVNRIGNFTWCQKLLVINFVSIAVNSPQWLLRRIYRYQLLSGLQQR